jgi:hypothetical protein
VRYNRRVNIALNLALACLILSFAVDGNIFQSSVVEQIARKVLALVALNSQDEADRHTRAILDLIV